MRGRARWRPATTRRDRCPAAAPRRRSSAPATRRRRAAKRDRATRTVDRPPTTCRRRTRGCSRWSIRRTAPAAGRRSLCVHHRPPHRPVKNQEKNHVNALRIQLNDRVRGDAAYSQTISCCVHCEAAQKGFQRNVHAAYYAATSMTSVRPSVGLFTSV